MVDHPGRLALALLVLVAIAVAAYWWWDPIRDPAIRFDPSSAALPRERSDDGAASLEPVGIRQSTPPLTPPRQPTPAQPAPDGPRLAAKPEFREYVVRRGDTLEDIARRELGSARHAAAIRRANPMKDTSRLNAGDVIRIPLDPANIQGKEPPGPAAPKDAMPGEYEVAKGDSLSKIAVKFYGSSKYADLIFNANRGILKNKDSVRVGQKLVLPPKPH